MLYRSEKPSLHERLSSNDLDQQENETKPCAGGHLGAGMKVRAEPATFYAVSFLGPVDKQKSLFVLP